MVGVMMTTFILFFAFVINTGMLVNAKINLQNAADLAAYAGASVQARQLTHISYLNYEMRRQWKKFLFRLYVIGNMAQDSFPRSAGLTGPMRYAPDNAFPNDDYGIPATCVIFQRTDNFCHLAKLPKIELPPPSVLDSITDTLRGQLQSIEQIRQMNCKAIGMTNKMLNIYWLFNADPLLTQLNTANLDQDQKNAIRIIQGLTYGLGIVPREIILRYRIRTLNDYVNTRAEKSVNKGRADGLLNSTDPAAYERTLQAFYSAYYTLGNHSFPSESITLEELIPGDTSAAVLLMLKNISQQIDTYAIDFSLNGAVGGAASTNPNDCEAKMIPISLGKPLVVGVYKDPAILTYYAVRLRAKAKILFSPFGDLELKAYSAAQPFGSRIGPIEGAVKFASEIEPGSARVLPTTSGGKAMIPNLHVKKDDTVAKGRGWDSQEVVGSMYQFLIGGAGGRLSDTLTATDMERTYIPAMAPNPWEGNRYNIPNDVGFDSFIRHFASEPGNGLGEMSLAAFWAPVFAPDKIASASQDIKVAVDSLFDANIQGNNGLGGDPIGKLRATLQTGLETYLQALQQGRGELGEGNNIVRITNPFVQVTPSGPQPISGNPEIFMTNDPKQFKTSWNTVNDATYRNEGRVGYSVKFVSFDSLTKKKMTTNGQNTWSNGLGADAEAEADLPFVKH
jgi:hypothetical protein